MVSGFYLGGAAEGIESARKLDAKDAEIANTSEGLRIARDRLVMGEAEKAIAGSLGFAVKFAEAARAAGHSPQAIMANPAMRGLLGDVEAISSKIGRDPTPYLRQVEATASMPSAPDTPDAPKLLTELAKLKADFDNGLIEEPVYRAKVLKLTDPTKDVNSVEGIRRKIAAGEDLTPGEKRVYDDAIRADPLARFLAGVQGGAPAPAPAAAPALPAAGSKTFNSDAEVQAAVKAGTVKVGDIVTVGGKRIRVAP
jgi:hypothetical protein